MHYAIPCHEKVFEAVKIMKMSGAGSSSLVPELDSIQLENPGRRIVHFMEEQSGVWILW